MHIYIYMYIYIYGHLYISYIYMYDWCGGVCERVAHRVNFGVNGVNGEPDICMCMYIYLYMYISIYRRRYYIYIYIYIYIFMCVCISIEGYYLCMCRYAQVHSRPPASGAGPAFSRTREDKVL